MCFTGMYTKACTEHVHVISFLLVQDTALASQLLQCVAEGKPLVVGDVDLQSLPSEGEHNPLRDVLMCRTTSDGKQPVKTTVSNNTVSVKVEDEWIG